MSVFGTVTISQVTPGTTNGVQVNAALPAGANVIGHVIADSGSTTAVTGNVTVVQGTGSNLHAVVDSGTITTVSTVTAVTAITNALPAGTNAIGKLAANTGVTIGAVEIAASQTLATVTNLATIGTSVTPGTSAAHLGKAEDAAHSSGDTGVFALAVSNENNTAFAAASGDYTPVAVNRYGQTYVTAPPPSHASSNGTPITATTTTVIAAPSAGNHLRIVRFVLSNGGATACWAAIRDGASGTRHYNYYLMQGAGISLNLASSGPLDLTTATRLDIFMSAAGSIEYEIDYFTVAD